MAIHRLCLLCFASAAPQVYFNARSLYLGWARYDRYAPLTLLSCVYETYFRFERDCVLCDFAAAKPWLRFEMEICVQKPRICAGFEV